ncbi:hypothetical protein Hanom_Chr12g01071881 [Helianthus anomalus]
MFPLTTVGDPSHTSHSNPNFSTSTTDLPKSPKHLSSQSFLILQPLTLQFQYLPSLSPSTYSLHILGFLRENEVT